jgi:serine/threonine protein kinase
MALQVRPSAHMEHMNLAQKTVAKVAKLFRRKKDKRTNGKKSSFHIGDALEFISVHSGLESPELEERKQLAYSKAIKSLSTFASEECPLEAFHSLQVICECSTPGCKILTAVNSIHEDREKVILKIAMVSGDYEDNLLPIENEARLMSLCDHPNIVKYYGTYLFESSVWIEMEDCSNGKLTNLITSGYEFSEEHIASMAKEILQGIQYLHDNLIAHCDLKSDNILISKDYTLKIADFGLSKQLHQKSERRRNSCGTPYWMAPEQIGDDAMYGIEADIWASGITVIEIANGVPPLIELDQQDAMQRIKQGKIPTLEGNWSPLFRQFMECIFITDPYKRYSAKRLLSHPFITSKAKFKPSEFLPDLIPL